MRQPALVALRLVSRVVVKDVASISTLSRSPAFLRQGFASRAAPDASIGATAGCFRTVLRSTSSAKDDDYDDWYAEFDPSEWESKADTAAMSYDYGKRTTARPHDYTRDVSVDTSNVDVGAIDALLSERLEAKKTRRFDVADQIRDDLLDNYGVMVWDKEKTWRTGCSRSGSGMRRPESRRKQRGSPPRDRDFGPLGHDYLECEESSGTYSSSLSDKEMHKLIAERLQCKLSRDFQRADEIQSVLAETGVFLHDGRKEWRADGVPFGDLYTGNSPKPGRERGSRTVLGPNGHDYDLAPDAGPIASSLSEEEIHGLIAERLQCKMNRNFAKADNIQEELIRNGVYIHDKKKQWRADGEPFEELSDRRGERRKGDGPAGDYSQSKFSTHLSPEDTETVVRLVSQRSAARRKRDYGSADDIQDELRLDWEVEIDDKKREWSVGGDFGREQEGPRSRQWIRRGGGNLADNDIATVTSLLDQRTQAKKERNFAVADAIRNELRDTYSVSIDDSSFEWRVLSDDYVLVGAPQLDADTMSYVQESLAKRLLAKQDRDYDIADSIRDDLRETYSVVIDDRTREWRIDGEIDDVSSKVMHVEDSSDEDLDAELEAILENKNTCNESELQTDEDFSSMTVPQLKEKLRNVGLPVSGRKADLIIRLTNEGM